MADPGRHLEVVGFEPEVVAPLAEVVRGDEVESFPLELAERRVGAASLGVVEVIASCLQ